VRTVHEAKHEFVAGVEGGNDEIGVHQLPANVLLPQQGTVCEHGHGRIGHGLDAVDEFVVPRIEGGFTRTAEGDVVRPAG